MEVAKMIKEDWVFVALIIIIIAAMIKTIFIKGGY